MVSIQASYDAGFVAEGNQEVEYLPAFVALNEDFAATRGAAGSEALLQSGGKFIHLLVGHGEPGYDGGVFPFATFPVEQNVEPGLTDVGDYRIRGRVL